MPNFTMTPTEKYASFLADASDVDRTLMSQFNRNGHPMNDIFEILENQIDAHKRFNGYVRPFRSVQELKGILRNPTDPRLVRFEPCLRNLVDCWGKAADYQARGTGWTLTQAAKPELDRCRAFACSDAVTFRGCINPEVEGSVLDRAKKRGGRTGMAFLGNLGGGGRRDETARWDDDHLRRTHKQVYSKFAGECTSFGYAAAHTLSRINTLQQLNARIEVVVSRQTNMVRATQRVANPGYDETQPIGPNNKKSHSVPAFTTKRKYYFWKVKVPAMQANLVTHVFCLVNRAGGTTTVPVGANNRPMEKLPSPDQWGKDCYIVDTWLASLGHASVFTVDRYPFKSMLQNLYQEMDSLGAVQT